MEDNEILKVTTCLTCKKAFRGNWRQTNARKHMEKHEHSNDNECTLCGKSFTKKRPLEAHLMRHFGQMPYNCKNCTERFPTENELRKHDETTHNRKHICTDCGKSFPYKSELETHRRSHIGEKPFLCLKCDYAFADSSSFRRHTETKVHNS